MKASAKLVDEDLSAHDWCFASRPSFVYIDNMQCWLQTPMTAEAAARIQSAAGDAQKDSHASRSQVQNHLSSTIVVASLYALTNNFFVLLLLISR